MKYQLLAAGAALAPLAAAGNVNRRDGQWGLNARNVQYVTDVDVVTAYDVVTVYGDAPPAQASTTAAPVAAQSSVVPGAAQSSVDSSFVVAPAESTLAPGTIALNIETTSNAASSTAEAVQSETQAAASAQSTDSTDIDATSSYTQAAHTVKVTSTVAAAASAAPSSKDQTSTSGKNITTSSLSPRGKKAGLSGYVGIQQMSAFKSLAPYISWYSDYTADTPSSGSVVGVGMLWAATGSTCGSEVTNRLNTFDTYVATTTPEIMFGFYEPDCNCPDSSSMSTSQGATAWNKLIAPLKSKGAVLGSPSMCKQKDETWLTPFKSAIQTDWDVTSVHINKPNITGVKQDIEYYAAKYGKPIWVSEFACVDDHDTWQPCTDQAQINQFINDCVEFFQGNDTVVAYGPSNGNGLGTTWPLTAADGSLTESGTTYLNAIKGL